MVGLLALLWRPLFASRPAAGRLVTYSAQRVGGNYLANPGIGWQGPAGGRSSLLPETVAYRRPQYGWRDQNPAEGVYDWSAVDADLQQAAAEGKQFSFRLYTMSSPWEGGHRVPDWVLNKGAVILDNGEVDYSNCTYQAEWGRFVEAMRQKYDGHPNLAFLDISGYGNYNEWSWQEQTDTREYYLDYQARQRLADAFIGGADTIECRDEWGEWQTVSYSYAGFHSTQLLMPFAGIQQSSRYVAERRPDVGIRHDCLGSARHADTLLDKIGDLVDATWPYAPIVYEFCPDEAGSEEFLEEAADLLQRTHASLVHDVAPGAIAQDDLVALLGGVGYQFAFTEATFPAVATPGRSFDFRLTWVNQGYAPAYPKMGQYFELRLYLVAADETVAQAWLLDAGMAGWRPADPLPGDPPEQTIRARLTPGLAVAPGQYTLRVAIVDTRTGRPIGLANDGRDEQGHYGLGSLRMEGREE